MTSSVRYRSIATVLAWATGWIEAMLVLRLLARLFAARPDNRFIITFYYITAPLRQPLAFLDAQQPRFGAVLELSTLVLVVLMPIVVFAFWHVLRALADATQPDETVAEQHLPEK